MVLLLFFGGSVVSNTLWPHELHHTRLPCPSLSQCLLKLMSIELVMPSNHLILCCPLLLLPSIFPRIRVFSNESALRIRWVKYWSFSFRSVLPMNIQDWLPLGSPCSPRDSQESSPAPQFESIISLLLSLLCNKECMIWTIVSTQSCFCWLYRPSPSSVARNIISLVLILTFRWCSCLLWSVHSFGKTLLAFALLHFVLQAQICLLLISWLPTLELLSPMKKRTSFFFFFWMFVLEGHVGLHRTVQLQLLQH